MLLEYERKKERKEKAALQLTSGASPIVKLGSGSAGIHVVAPCPHDGVCPMHDKNMWCHFSQRYQRTRAQRVVNIIPENKQALKRWLYLN